MYAKRLMLGVVVVLLGGSALRADTTYNLINYPAEQDGWTLTGSITLEDGYTGYITYLTGGITAWQFEATKPSETTLSASSLSGSIGWYSDGIFATSTSLILPSNVGFSEYGFYLKDSDNAPMLLYVNSYGELGDYYESYRLSNSPEDPPWSHYESSSDPIPSRVIAVVPEPGTFILGVGALCVGLAYAVRKRRLT